MQNIAAGHAKASRQCEKSVSHSTKPSAVKRSEERRINMARAGGKDRGITQRKDRDGWWVRIFHNGRERWHKCDTKSQAKALYGRLKADAREGRYFPKQERSISVKSWIGRCLEGSTNRDSVHEAQRSL